MNQCLWDISEMYRMKSWTSFVVLLIFLVGDKQIDEYILIVSYIDQYG